MKAFLFLLAAAGWAQSPDTFEVASIKLGDPVNPGTSVNFQPGASVKIQGAPLKMLIQFAYELQDFQLTGATGWMATERYDILAKGRMTEEGPADYRQMNDAQRKVMAALIRKRLQALLAERFQLVVHRETKELPMYALVVAKNGLKMQANTSPDGSPQSMTMGRGMYKGTRAAVDRIAEGLAGLVGRPVDDQTGLKGFFDFKMEWTPDAPAGLSGPEEKQLDTFGPTLFTAVQEQLGLKLESKKGPVQVFVIDKAEKASEN